MNDSGQGDRPDGERPEYKVYRSGRKPSLPGSGGLDALRKRRGQRPDPGRPDDPRAPRTRRPITPGRVLKWVALAIVGWILLSLVLFVVSAQLNEGVDADDALSGNGNFFSGTTILVLGSDQRKGASIDKSDTGPGRADSIMLVHAKLGKVTKLSIPRDSLAEIPGHGSGKINGAYAIGGPKLMTQTVEQFLGNGVRINHLVEVDFKDFPAFIDSLGGITVDNKSRICAPEFDNFYRGFRLRKGERKLNGRKALGFARVRKNPCAPAETDLDRAARQQEVLRGIRGKMFSPGTFVRLPWVSWRAPRTVRTDLRGPGLLSLAGDMATGGAGGTRVLKPEGLTNPLIISDSEKQSEARALLGE